jgi:predicted transcriptional regulator
MRDNSLWLFCVLFSAVTTISRHVDVCVLCEEARPLDIIRLSNLHRRMALLT